VSKIRPVRRCRVAEVNVELRDVADGLWLWRQPHLDWSAGHHWEPEVSSFAVDAGGVGVLLDPLAPPAGSSAALWERLEALAPEAVVILKPDHVRDVDLFVRWYGLRALGPRLFLPATFPAPRWSPSCPVTSFRVACGRCTTAATSTRRRCTCPSSWPSSSPTASRRPTGC
jgi:hypothetical protein